MSRMVLPPVPTGVMLPFAGPSNKVPNGWLLCDGSAVSRTAYAALFGIIGTCWGVGDGATTFRLPDPRGRFLRGVDGGAGNDPDRAARVAADGGNAGDNVGSGQGDDYKAHTHDTGYTTSGTGSAKYAISTYMGQTFVGLAATTATAPAVNGNETRPKNVGVHYIIKT